MSSVDNSRYNEYFIDMKLGEEIGKRGAFESVEQEAQLNVVRTADFLLRGMDELFARWGLTSTQYNVLRILRGAGEDGLACREIGQRMISRDPDITRLLDRLEKRGLIHRCRAESDRRSIRARIAEKGLTLLAELDEPVRVFHRQQLGHMGEHKLRKLIELLEEARSVGGQ
jgi:DNA-binding MarR family transcriptional regulator